MKVQKDKSALNLNASKCQEVNLNNRLVQITGTSTGRSTSNMLFFKIKRHTLIVVLMKIHFIIFASKLKINF